MLSGAAVIPLFAHPPFSLWAQSLTVDPKKSSNVHATWTEEEVSTQVAQDKQIYIRSVSVSSMSR